MHLAACAQEPPHPLGALYPMQHTDNLIAAYERHARERDTSSTAELKEQEKREFLEYLKEEARRTILELGCGPGHDSVYFRDQGFTVFAVDNTPTMVELATQKGVNSRVMDCYHLDRITQTFDAVYSMNCLLHKPNADIGRVLGLISARLKVSGLIYLGLWGGDDFEGIWEGDTYEPKRFFSFRSARSLLEVVQREFRIEYYRRLEPRPSSLFNSLIARKPEDHAH